MLNTSGCAAPAVPGSDFGAVVNGGRPSAADAPPSTNAATARAEPARRAHPRRDFIVTA
jgi:hypothetical protein